MVGSIEPPTTTKRWKPSRPGTSVMLRTSTTSPMTARPSPPAVLGRTARRAGKGSTMIRARGRGSRLGGELPAEVDLRGRRLVVVVGAVRAAVQELDLDDVGTSAGRSPR